jgi:hypothetical protein
MKDWLGKIDAVLIERDDKNDSSLQFKKKWFNKLMSAASD